MRSPITTHALDTRTGTPACRLSITLSQLRSGEWREIAAGATNDDGRITDLLKPGELTPGTYQMRFDTGAYHEAHHIEGFYPEALITFEVKNTEEHYHIPLLLSPFGYSTYRGS